jgi:hypothetical protein
LAALEEMVPSENIWHVVILPAVHHLLSHHKPGVDGPPPMKNDSAFGERLAGIWASSMILVLVTSLITTTISASCRFTGLLAFVAMAAEIGRVKRRNGVGGMGLNRIVVSFSRSEHFSTIATE